MVGTGSASSSPRLLIVGAGIGGLSLAAALSGSKFLCELVERRNRSLDDGTGITISSEGLEALGHLRCSDEAKRKGRLIEKVVVANQLGERLGCIDFRAINRRDRAALSIRRPVLRDV